MLDAFFCTYLLLACSRTALPHRVRNKMTDSSRCLLQQVLKSALLAKSQPVFDFLDPDSRSYSWGPRPSTTLCHACGPHQALWADSFDPSAAKYVTP
jgi:hypothetical protein